VLGAISGNHAGMRLISAPPSHDDPLDDANTPHEHPASDISSSFVFINMPSITIEVQHANYLIYHDVCLFMEHKNNL